MVQKKSCFSHLQIMEISKLKAFIFPLVLIHQYKKKCLNFVYFICMFSATFIRSPPLLVRSKIYTFILKKILLLTYIIVLTKNVVLSQLHPKSLIKNLVVPN